jgi:hypothetical protein
LAEPEEMHYSVFGDKYVLLQAKHEHGQRVKEVWFAESAPLNRILTERAKGIIGRGMYLPPSIFKELTLSISSETALCALSILDERKRMSEGEFRSGLQLIGLSEETYADLKAAAFVEEITSSVRITTIGENYLQLFS